MSPKKPESESSKLDKIIAEALRNRTLRETAYRDRALRLFPHVCARCGLEFTGKRLRELTVHHKDHNHENNPPDGSNWELLCVYCHDKEHGRYSEDESHDEAESWDEEGSGSGYRPFAGLQDLLKDKK
ncbi:MAG: HNH nuclease family protein [Desulfomonile tiedjei]|nr:HNH nuclease family protein [Desulfomonile tiedjei]